MNTLTLRTRLDRDGTLTLPPSARQQLNLQPGDEIELTVRRADADPPALPNNPLLQVIGIGKGGATDGAENHDAELYGHRAK